MMSFSWKFWLYPSTFFSHLHKERLATSSRGHLLLSAALFWETQCSRARESSKKCSKRQCEGVVWMLYMVRCFPPRHARKRDLFSLSTVLVQDDVHCCDPHYHTLCIQLHLSNLFFIYEEDARHLKQISLGDARRSSRVSPRMVRRFCSRSKNFPQASVCACHLDVASATGTVSAS